MSDTIDFPTPLLLDGNISAVTIDLDSNPNRVLEIGRAWQVETSWYLTGSAVDMMDGTWHLEVRMESMGDGFEGTAVKADVPWIDGTLAAHRIDFKKVLDVPATIPDPAVPENLGVYKLVTLLTFTNVFGKPVEIAGFAEQPLIQFYKPE